MAKPDSRRDDANCLPTANGEEILIVIEGEVSCVRLTNVSQSLPMRSGLGPPSDNDCQVLPSIEVIDLTGLPDDEEHEVNAADHDDNDEWEDVPDVIDLTNLPTDDEDEDEDVAELAKVRHGRATAGSLQRKFQRLRKQTCELCNRVARYDRGITKHHLYPQSVVKAAPNGTYTKKQKKATAQLCWPCHSAIHRIMPNETLAASFHSVELLSAHGEVQAWVRKMQRATTAELDAPSQKSRALRVAARVVPKRRTKLLLGPLPVQRPLPSQRPKEDLSLFAELRRSARLAELGTGAPGAISRVGAFSTSGACGVKKVGMTKKERKLARKLEQAAKVPQINRALDALWEQNGNSFPRYDPGTARKNRVLRDMIRNLSGNYDVQGNEVRAVLRSRNEYREWHDWAFSPPELEAPLQIPAGSLAVDGIQSPEVPENNGGTTAMEGIETQSNKNGDEDPSVMDESVDLAVLEGSGDYIPL